MKLVLHCFAVGALLCSAQPVTAAVFTDDFNSTASAGSYTVVTSSADTSVIFGFDYSALNIPVAPNTTDGSTLGLRMAANISAPADRQAVTLQTNENWTGNYRVRFDLWMNANGPFPGGGAGSTEFITAGVGGDRTTVNLDPLTGSGGWTAASGEGGASQDFRMYKGSTSQGFASGQFRATDIPNEPPPQDGGNPYYNQFGGIDVGPIQGSLDAAQTGVTASGSIGFAWQEVELLVDPTGGTGGEALVTWSISGLEIGGLDAGLGAFVSDGAVTIGYMDTFTSVSGNPTFSFGLVDNLRIENVPEPSSLLFGLGLSACGLVYRRRRM